MDRPEIDPEGVPFCQILAGNPSSLNERNCLLIDAKNTSRADPTAANVRLQVQALINIVAIVRFWRLGFQMNFWKTCIVELLVQRRKINRLQLIPLLGHFSKSFFGCSRGVQLCDGRRRVSASYFCVERASLAVDAAERWLCRGRSEEPACAKKRGEFLVESGNRIRHRTACLLAEFL